MTDKEQKLRYTITAIHMAVDFICIIVLFSLMGMYVIKYGYNYFFGTLFGSFRRALCFFILIDTASCLIELWKQKFFTLHGISSIMYTTIIGFIYFPAMHIPVWMGILFFVGPAVPYIIYLFIRKHLDKIKIHNREEYYANNDNK